MKKNVFRATAFALSLLALTAMLCGCGRKENTAETVDPALNGETVSVGETVDPTEAEDEDEGELTDEQALSAVRNYCYTANPGLEDIVNAGEYQVYWEIASSGDEEVVVLYRSYTGAEIRYYIDRTTGEASVTEYVPGITPEEEQTDESLNIRDYLAED